MFEALLLHRLDPNAIFPLPPSYATCLIWAVRDAGPSTIARLLAAGAQVDATVESVAAEIRRNATASRGARKSIVFGADVGGGGVMRRVGSPKRVREGGGGF
jgi:hypothetical protein